MHTQVTFMRRLALAVAAATVGFAGTAPAADLGARLVPEPGMVLIDLPTCNDPAVLEEIVETQHWAARETWQNGIYIEGISDIRERKDTLTFTTFIPRRHCVARADLTLDHSDQLFYVIYAEQGFAGVSWKVNFCMPRYDYWKVYDADCRVLR